MHPDSIYQYFTAASGKFVITGPGFASGRFIQDTEAQAKNACACLNDAYDMGKRSKAAEFRKVLNIPDSIYG